MNQPRILSLSAVTLATRDMARAVAFYDALGFAMLYGGAPAAFTSYRLGASYLNLIAQDVPLCWWGRVIIHVSDVDAMHRLALAAGFAPSSVPADAPWGERYFHISDPDGHELSFAAPRQAEAPSS
jgi:catechol 2,3-dioxygenase-like lactoylglutathione lyase family enzyme